MLFTFMDGQFGYDCAACGARCCKEAGTLYLGTSQDRALESLGGAIVVKGFGHDFIRVNIGKDGCPALSDDNRCNIQKTHGFTEKPFVCAWMPFFFLPIDETTTVVGPALHGHCPWELVASPKNREASSYRNLWSILRLHRQYLGSTESSLARDGDFLENEARFVIAANQAREDDLIEVLAAYEGFERQKLIARCVEAFSVLGDELTLNEAPTVASALLPALRSFFYHAPPRDLTLATALGLLLSASALNRAANASPRRVASVFLDRLPLAMMLSMLDVPIERFAEPRQHPADSSEMMLEIQLVVKAVRQEPGRHSVRTLLSDTRMSPLHKVALLHAMYRMKPEYVAVP